MGDAWEDQPMLRPTFPIPLTTSSPFQHQWVVNRETLARDIMLKLLDAQCLWTEAGKMEHQRLATESVAQADALLAELAKPKEAP